MRFGPLCLLLVSTWGCDVSDSFARDAGAGEEASVQDAAQAGPELCFDGIDNDDNAAADCQDAQCRELPICCVESARAECCEEPQTQTLPSAIECDDGPADDCLAGFTLFGEATPVVEDGGIVPLGGLGVGGVVLGERVDLRSTRTTLRATIVAPAGRCVDCIDATGVALIDDVTTPNVRAGVLVSGSRSEIQVVVGNETLTRRPLPDNEAHEYEVTVTPEGDFTVTLDGTEIAHFSDLPLAASVQPVVYGRTDNRPADVPAVHLRAARIETSVCDFPRALDRRETPVLPWAESAWEPAIVRRPSVAHVGDDPDRGWVMAYASEGTLYLAQRTGSGEFRDPIADPGAPLRQSDREEELPHASDPWLVVADDRLHLYYAVEEGDGTRRLERTISSPGRTDAFGPPERIVLPDSVQSVDGPSVIGPGPSGAPWRLAARVVFRDGQSGIALFQGSDGIRFELTPSDFTATLAPTVVRATPDLLFAVDRDEVATPALIELNGVLRLYYSARRGARWRIALSVSADGGANFRSLGEILEGDERGFDSRSVMDPAPVLRAEGLLLYYAGDDGARTRIGVAQPGVTP